MVGFGPIAILFIAPSLLRDRVVVDDAGFHSRAGVWGLTAVHDVAYGDVKKARVISDMTTARRDKYSILCEMKGGWTVTFPAKKWSRRPRADDPPAPGREGGSDHLRDGGVTEIA